MTRRKNDYGRRRGGNTYKPPQTTEEMPERPTLATINLEAAVGKAGMNVGDRVVITAKGAYTGETAVIERISGAAIPSAVVRTESGGTRHVRTIDLVHATEKPKTPAAPTAEAPARTVS